MANDFLSKCDDTADKAIAQLSHLIEGFESPYGLELLSTVHWVAGHEGHYPFERIVSEIQSWSHQKSNRFDEPSIRTAYQRLVDDKLLH